MPKRLLSTISALALGMAMSSTAAIAQEVRGPEAVGSTAAPPVPAQTPAAAVGPSLTQATSNDPGLAEIAVTARSATENLQSVPVAITAFSGAQLQQQSARSVSDVAMPTPGLQIFAELLLQHINHELLPTRLCL